MSDLSVRFWGGARTVTGSRHLLSFGRQKLLLECGLFQGHREEAEQINRHLPFKAREVDYCVISHAHIDHCGNIPNLEIGNNDVKCSHGATVSNLDPETVFYLKSRGIAERDARSLLLASFIAPVLDLYADEELDRIRENVRGIIDEAR